MVTLAEAYRVAHYDQQFREIVRMGLLAIALGVLAEPEDTEHHAARLAMAKRLLADPAFLVERACEVLALGGMTGETPEAEIATGIAAQATAISVAFAPEESAPASLPAMVGVMSVPPNWQTQVAAAKNVADLKVALQQLGQGGW